MHASAGGPEDSGVWYDIGTFVLRYTRAVNGSSSTISAGSGSSFGATFGPGLNLLQSVRGEICGTWDTCGDHLQDCLSMLAQDVLHLLQAIL